jgi:hypothetical protein
MKVDGCCHCGRITFEAEVDPDKVLICHCTDCQTLSGGAFRTVVRVPANAFRLLSGKPKVYVKQADSGNRFAKLFATNAAVPSTGRTLSMIRSSTGCASGHCVSATRFRRSCKYGVVRRSRGSVIWTTSKKSSDMLKAVDRFRAS